MHFWLHFCLDISQGTLLWVTSAQQTLKAATEPMFRQPPGLWGLFGFSNLLCYNKTTQVFPGHGSKFLFLMTLHTGHSSEVLYMPPLPQNIHIHSKEWGGSARLCAVPPIPGTTVALKAVGTSFNAFLAFLLVPRKHKAVVWGGRRGMRREIKG